jgi:hypothetical protein
MSVIAKRRRTCQCPIIRRMVQSTCEPSHKGKAERQIMPINGLIRSRSSSRPLLPTLFVAEQDGKAGRLDPAQNVRPPAHEGQGHTNLQRRHPLLRALIVGGHMDESERRKIFLNLGLLMAR